METWSPLTLFVAQYAVAGFGALFALCLSSKPLTLRLVFGWAGFYCLLGGSFAPLARELSVWPAACSKAERVLVASFALGGSVVPVPWVLQLIAVKLGIKTDATDNK